MENLHPRNPDGEPIFAEAPVFDHDDYMRIVRAMSPANNYGVPNGVTLTIHGEWPLVVASQYAATFFSHFSKALLVESVGGREYKFTPDAWTTRCPHRWLEQTNGLGMY